MALALVGSLVVLLVSLAAIVISGDREDEHDALVVARVEEPVLHEPPPTAAPPVVDVRASVRTPEPEPEPAETQDAEPEEPDESGLTWAGKLDQLERGWITFEESKDSQMGSARASQELVFARTAVITILRSQGRVSYQKSDGGDGTTGYMLRPSDEKAHRCIAASGLYEWPPGEFPSYDLAMERLLAAQDGEAIADLSPEQAEGYALLYAQALEALGPGPN